MAEDIKPVQASAAAVKFEKVTIETDGTKAGTKVLVNGKAVANMSSLSFYWYDSCYAPISFSYTVRDPDNKPGTLHSCTTFRLNCPSEPSAYANKAQASLEDPNQMILAFAKSETDENLEKHEHSQQQFNRSEWSKLK